MNMLFKLVFIEMTVEMICFKGFIFIITIIVKITIVIIIMFILMMYQQIRIMAKFELLLKFNKNFEYHVINPKNSFHPHLLITILNSNIYNSFFQTILNSLKFFYNYGEFLLHF